jgi:hypothetical protein
MGSELETRRNDRGYLFQILKAQNNSSTPHDFEELLAWTMAQMESDDVKMVLQGFEEWKKKKI